jgi:membrane protein implicated in regulation of membrane protease activity
MQNRSLSYLWAVAGAYLIFLGIKQFIALFDGSATIPVVNGLAGVVFVVFGGAVILREWRNYRRNSAPQDPEEETADEAEDIEVEE